VDPAANLPSAALCRRLGLMRGSCSLAPGMQCLSRKSRPTDETSAPRLSLKRLYQPRNRPRRGSDCSEKFDNPEKVQRPTRCADRQAAKPKCSKPKTLSAGFWRDTGSRPRGLFESQILGQDVRSPLYIGPLSIGPSTSRRRLNCRRWRTVADAGRACSRHSEYQSC
jgi:hypothetical protein